MALLLLLSAQRPAAAQDAFIQGGTLVDPRTGDAVAANLLILDPVIAGRPASPPAGFGGITIDALDLFSPECVILRDRQRADRAAVLGADVFAAAPCLTATAATAASTASRRD